jgi:putative endonuclease
MVNSVGYGRKGEITVAKWLEKFGAEILAMNFAVKGGEIDIIAAKDDIIAFVEVKTRSDFSVSNGFDVIDEDKKRRIIRTAFDYIGKNNITKQPRFDIAVVIFAEKKHINYVKNAFDTDCVFEV